MIRHLLTAALLALTALPGAAPPAGARLTIGFIGDSITVLDPGGGNPASRAVRALSAPGLTVLADNQAVRGTATRHWLPGTGLIAGAKGAFVAARVRLVAIMLGTNDAYPDGTRVSAAAYLANMRAIVGDLRRSGFMVAISYSPYVVPHPGWKVWTPGVDTALLGYERQIDTLIDGRRVLPGDRQAYRFFRAHPSELYDGLHPNSAGAADLARLWAGALRPAVRAVLAEPGRSETWRAAPRRPGVSGVSAGARAPLTRVGGLIHTAGGLM